MDIYHEIFENIRQNPITILEFGVQNGGSLEIWSRFFNNFKFVIGVDVDSSIALLNFNNENIITIVGDATSVETAELISSRFGSIDVVVDDGSHINTDVIKTFLLNWNVVSEGGFYAIEDTHSSYQQSYGGGFQSKNSIINFFKILVELTHFEFWGLNISILDLFEESEFSYLLSEARVDLTNIESIHFFQSMIVLKKKKLDNKMIRVVKGKTAKINSQVLNYNSQEFEVESQDLNQFSRLYNPYNALEETELTLSRILSSKSWNFTRHFRLIRKLIADIRKKV